MQDDRSTPGSEDAVTSVGQNLADGEPAREDVLDKYDDGVIAADATGMLAGEKLITEAEIEEGLGGKDPLAGDV